MASHVIDELPVSEVDRLEDLWCRLTAHHGVVAPHLAEIGALRAPAESWRLRRAQYAGWAGEPATRILVARDGERILGYAVVRVVHAPGSWQWGDDVGVLETLVVDDGARGTGVGRALLSAARAHLTSLSITVMKITVIDGNDGASRFYRRDGGVGYCHTLVMPVEE
jgi:ribosomal protein S18 acetylase RimI-like enzyme